MAQNIQYQQPQGQIYPGGQQQTNPPQPTQQGYAPTANYQPPQQYPVYQPNVNPQDVAINVNPQEQPLYEKEFGLAGSARGGFIRKVYGILTAMLIVTTCFCVIPKVSKEFAEFQQKNQGLLIAAGCIYIVLFILLLCCSHIAKRVPINYIFLFLFTISVSYLISSVVAFYPTMKVIMAFIMTVAATLVLTFYACKNEDAAINYCFFSLIVAPVIAVIAIIFMVVYRNSTEKYEEGTSWIWQGLLIMLVIVIYGNWIVWDTQLICGNGYCGVKFSIDDYVIGAMILYMDIIQLFLKILQVLAIIVFVLE